MFSRKAWKGRRWRTDSSVVSSLSFLRARLINHLAVSGGTTAPMRAAVRTHEWLLLVSFYCWVMGGFWSLISLEHPHCFQSSGLLGPKVSSFEKLSYVNISNAVVSKHKPVLSTVMTPRDEGSLLEFALLSLVYSWSCWVSPFALLCFSAVEEADIPG